MSQVSVVVGKQIELDVADLTYFQGDLKDLDFENYEKLKKEILKHGFAFSPHVWLNDGQHFILDGHQRYRVLTKMREDGFNVPKIPCTLVEATDFKAAKELVLAGTSQFGQMTSEGLYEFITESGLDWREVITDTRFPEVEPTKFIEEFFAESAGGPGGSGGNEKEKPAIEIFKTEEIIDNAFAYFREAGFPYPKLELHEQKQEINRLANLDVESLVRSTVGYKVADTYHRHRFHAAAIKMFSPVEAFDDDKKLKKAIRWGLTSHSIGTDLWGALTLVNGTQACSNFRPAFAKKLYDEFCPKGGVVFDSSTGYGGRLVGFLASHCRKYIGTDPNVPTFKANQEIAKALGGHKEIELYNSPIEDLIVDEFAESVDLCFTSPPYFVKETYSEDKTQSCHRYPDYEDWLEGFLRPMLEKQLTVLKKGATNIVNIEDVTVGGKLYELVKPTIELAQGLGFAFVRVDRFELSARTMVVDGEKKTEQAFESVIILTKS